MNDYLIDLFEKCQTNTKLQHGTIDVHLYSESGDILKILKIYPFILISLDAEYYDVFSSGKFAQENFGYTLDSLETCEGFVEYIKDFILYLTHKKSIVIGDSDVSKYLTSSRFKHNIYRINISNIWLWYENLPRYTFEEIVKNNKKDIIKTLLDKDISEKIKAIKLKICESRELFVKSEMSYRNPDINFDEKLNDKEINCINWHYHRHYHHFSSN